MSPKASNDLIHARFVLTHLHHPAEALIRMREALKPGGVLVVEDIDFRGYFCYPESAAVRRYVELYTQTAARRGCDANIGPSLPGMLTDAGFQNVHMNVVQPAGTTGEVKLISPLTMQNIGEAVVAEGLASQTEVDRLVAELYHSHEHARHGWVHAASGGGMGLAICRLTLILHRRHTELAKSLP